MNYLPSVVILDLQQAFENAVARGQGIAFSAEEAALWSHGLNELAGDVAALELQLVQARTQRDHLLKLVPSELLKGKSDAPAQSAGAQVIDLTLIFAREKALRSAVAPDGGAA